MLSDHIYDAVMHYRDAKVLWDYLNTTYGASYAGKQLYIMESFHDYKMVNNHSVVEQAHEVQVLVKGLELLKCHIPDNVTSRKIHQVKSRAKNNFQNLFCIVELKSFLNP